MEYADDLNDINNISAELFGDPDFMSAEPEIADDYLEAQMAAAKKLSGPRM